MSKNSFKTPKWSKLKTEQLQPLDRRAGSWPMVFFSRNWRGQITDLNGELVSFKIRNPKFIDFYNEQLENVKNTMSQLNHDQRSLANYFGVSAPTKQWTPVIDRLIDTYEVSPARAARIIAITQAAINDAIVISWNLKYIFNVARPNQIDPNLQPLITTPAFPAYPSGHATLSGCAQVVLSYFFPAEANRLSEIAEQCAHSRTYAGVHFPVDNSEGLRLGKQIGAYIISQIENERDSNGSVIDQPFTEERGAILPPPPYNQAIAYPPIINRTPRRNPLFML